MAMTFSFHENLDLSEASVPFEMVSSVFSNSTVADERIHLFAEKMRIPHFDPYLSRPRLLELLKKSSAQTGATLIAGRAETGKTQLAADFAKEYDRVAWYQVDSAENDWNIFSRYFAAIFEENYAELSDAGGEIMPFVEQLLEKVARRGSEPLLVVLDDIHHVFDADWFPEFFVSLLHSLSPRIHLLLLSRSKPPQPLWRLRSKQVLGVIDEKLLAFNLEETGEFLRQHEISPALAERAHAETFGRLSTLKRFIETR